jgi:hypothetical protein
MGDPITALCVSAPIAGAMFLVMKETSARCERDQRRTLEHAAKQSRDERVMALTMFEAIVAANPEQREILRRARRKLEGVDPDTGAKLDVERDD